MVKECVCHGTDVSGVFTGRNLESVATAAGSATV